MFGAIGLSTHVWNNRLRAGLLLAGFPVLLVVLAFGLSMVFSAGESTVGQGFARAWRQLPAFIIGAVIVSLIWFAIAWAANQAIIDAVSGARVVSRETDRRLWDLMETLCIARGETMPRLAVIDTEARNAFASGLDRKKGSVTVTRGLVDALDDRALSAVLAHELTHIRNGDARLAVIAAVFTGIITLGFDVLRGRRGGGVADAGGSSQGGGTWGRRRGGSSRDGGINVAILAIGLVIIVLAGTLSVALRMALSRNREFLADAGAVQITGDADAMIAALRRIEGRAEMALPSQLQAMLLEHAAGSRGGSLWATHPPIGARIEALVRLAGGRDPGPQPDAPAAVPVEAAPKPAPAPAPPWGRNLPLPIPGLPPVILPLPVPGAAAPGTSSAAAPETSSAAAPEQPGAATPGTADARTPDASPWGQPAGTPPPTTYVDEVAALRAKRPPDA